MTKEYYLPTREEMIKRFDILSAKGWLNLERDELRELVAIVKFLEKN